MPNSFKVALVQMSAKVGDKRLNIERMLGFIEKAAGKRADLVVFPELILTGYVSKDLFFKLAEPVPGPSSQVIAEAASKYGVNVVYGMPEESAGVPGVLYNTLVFIHRDGGIEKYRKMYLPTYGMFEEGRYFRAGSTPKVVETDFGRIGLSICFDLFFPELIRMLALMGAHTIVNISASPDISRRFFEAFTVSRALENTVNVVYVNNVGAYEGYGFWGGSHVVNPHGRVVAKARYYEEDVVYASISLDEWRAARRGRPILKHFRADVCEMCSRFSEP